MYFCLNQSAYNSHKFWKFFKDFNNKGGGEHEIDATFNIIFQDDFLEKLITSSKNPG